MENRINNLFNYELLKRLITVIFFVPIIILPILYSYYFLVLINLIIVSIIFDEISNMKLKKSTLLLNAYQYLVIFSFFIFIIMLISGKENNYKIIEIILIIWLFDTFSYLGGKLIGGIKLIPRISKGKTVSGLLSGVILTTLSVQVIHFNFLSYSAFSIIFTLFIITLAFAGDLITSVIKRIHDLKDTGHMMPGHGGFLDRFDSFIAVFSVYGFLKLFI